MKLIGIATLAYIFGYIEQILYRNGFRAPEPRLFGWCSISYHLSLLIFWELICIIGEAWWFIGLFAVLEDDAYFRFHPTDTRDEVDWINAKLGGFEIFNAWIPYTYLIGIGISIILYFINELLI